MTWTERIFRRNKNEAGQTANKGARHGWMARVRIRPLMEADLPALEWEGEYTRYRRLYADAYLRAQQGRAVLWVADLAGVGVIGQLFVQLTTDRQELADGKQRAYIYAFRIRPAYRNSGLGTRMLRKAEADLRRRGFRYATLNVAKDNSRALNLYRRMGYRILASEAGRWSYPDENGEWHAVEEPAWRMEKVLS
jgi:ribosomal protein S18 acetylase RimI-like enzyme